MTQMTGFQSKYTKTLALSGTGVLALALLTGCSVADEGEPDADNGSATTAESSPATAETTSPSAGSDDSSASASSSSSSEASTAGEDPVFAAIDALLSEHSDAIIVQIDQDDDDTVYEIEAVLGDRVVDFDVQTDGSVREDDDDDDEDDDIRRADEAQITAEEAARTALDGREGQTIDGMELDEDNGTLLWEIDVDLESGEDGDELRVDAATGEVTQDN